MEYYGLDSPQTDDAYEITYMDGMTPETLTVWCQFDYSDPSYAWTLIQSGNLAYSLIMLREVWSENHPHNENGVLSNKESLYRMSLVQMNALKERSQYLLGTCDLDTSLAVDYWMLDLSAILPFDPFDDISLSGECIHSEYLNIRGIECHDQTVKAFNQENKGFYIDSNAADKGTGAAENGTVCECTNITTGSKTDEKNFGYYDSLNDEFECTGTSDSTTNWWLGEETDVSYGLCFFLPISVLFHVTF